MFYKTHYTHNNGERLSSIHPTRKVYEVIFLFYIIKMAWKKVRHAAAGYEDILWLFTKLELCQERSKWKGTGGFHSHLREMDDTRLLYKLYYLCLCTVPRGCSRTMAENSASLEITSGKVKTSFHFFL